MKTLLLLIACLFAVPFSVSAGDVWTNPDLGLEITFPDDWTVTDGPGYKELGVPLLDPGPKIVMLAQAPIGDTEAGAGVLQCVQIEVCEDTFGSYGSIASTLDENSRDIVFVGMSQPKVRDCKVSETQIGGIPCVKCTVLAYRSMSYLNHCVYAVRLTDKRVVFINGYYRDDRTRDYATELDRIVGTVKCSKAIAAGHIVAIGVGLGVGLVLLVLVLVVVKVRSSGATPPAASPFPFPDAPPPPPPPQTT